MEEHSAYRSHVDTLHVRSLKLLIVVPGQVVNIPDSYFGGPELKSWPGDWLSRQKFFVVFPQSLLKIRK
jgi:hypothetical protein